ncbi:hypothetical protein ACLOJK_002390 [Asimina triloba]
MEAGNNRRALRDLKNVMGAPFPRAAIKRSENQKLCIPRFAASLANKPLPPSQVLPDSLQLRESSNRSVLIPASKRSEHVLVIDVDDENMGVTEKSSLPALQSHAEAIPDEVEVQQHDGDTVEIEMKDAIIVEPVPDIDSCDCKNPLAVVDYVEDIYAFYRKAEVHYKFELMEETLFLTVNLIDRFLERQSVVRKKLQLVGITAMLLACKYEEVSVPVVEDLILISDKAYTRDEVLAMAILESLCHFNEYFLRLLQEKLMINTLQFNLSVPTPYVFMKRFLKAAQSNKKLELLSFFMIELCLVEYEMLKFPPSLLAAAAVYTAQCTLNGSRHWSKTCKCHARYTEDQLRECSKMIVDFHQKAGIGGKLTGVHRKYSTSKFGFAARTEPAGFLWDEP